MISSHHCLLRAVFSTLCVGVLLYVDNAFANCNPDLPPKWGAPVNPFMFKDLQECNRLKTMLRVYTQEFIEMNLFNSISDLVEFHTAYRKYLSRNSSTTVRDAYQKFSPQLKNAETSAYVAPGLITHLTNKLSSDSMFKNLYKSMYVVSVEKLVPTALFELYKQNGTQPQTRKMYDLIGCIRFTIQGKLGYILLDPRKGWIDPIFAMESEAAGTPHSGWKLYDGNRQQYLIIPTNQNFVYVHQYNDLRIPEIIYAGLPFLSATDFTQKPSLLQKYRAIIKRDKNGCVLASANFLAEPVIQNVRGKETCGAYFFIVVNGRKSKILFKYITYGKGALKENLDSDVFNAIQSASAVMQSKSGNLVNIIKGAGFVMEDFQFLREVQTLDESLDKRAETLNTARNQQRMSSSTKKNIAFTDGKNWYLNRAGASSSG